MSDPYKYFRIEARELLEALGVGVLELERTGGEKELLGRLFRVAHTLKGAARVVRLPRIAEAAHAIEDELSPYRDAQSPVPRERTDSLLQHLDAIGAALQSLDAPAAPAALAAAPASSPAAATPAATSPAAATPEAAGGASPASVQRALPSEPQTVRVDVGEVDLLIEGVIEAKVRVHGFAQGSPTLERCHQLAKVLAGHVGARRGADGADTANAKARLVADELMDTLAHVQRDFSTGVEQLAAELLQVHEAADRLRLLPASTIFPALERAVRDTAQAQGKTVGFRASSADCRLDGSVLGAVRDALLHIVRNAVAHGVEPEGHRFRGGKPREGSVEVTVRRRGARAVFACRDDGQGIDVEALRQVALRRGLVSPGEAAALDARGVFQLVLNGGLSTSSTVTEVAGRGVGLDVVRETVARLKGEVRARSEPGLGTTIELSVPISRSALTALMVEASGLVAAVPLDAVRCTLRLADEDVSRAGGVDSILLDGSLVPVAPLTRLFRDAQGPQPPKKGRHTAVVVSAGATSAAIVVDALRGVANVAVRALPEYAEVDAVIAGATLDAEGNPQWVLDPEAVVDAVRARRSPTSEPEARPRLPVLVIDDSLTTRMLEQSILESAGYEVDLATSAEEGVVRARTRRYGLFLVDVEMPGMDGFAFVTLTRADPVLRETPAILVTSRESPEDRKRGRDAGAYDYVVKGEFDQGRLLNTIHELLG